MNHRFARALIGFTCAVFGSQVLPVAVALAAVADGGGIAGIGAALAARTLGFVTALIPAGAMTDRLGPNRVMAGAYSIMFILGISTVLSLGHSPSLALVSLLLIGAGEAAVRPAYQTAMIATVKTENLERANGLSTLGTRTAMVIGPGAAAGLAATAGAQATIWLCVALWAFALAVSLPGVRRIEEEPRRVRTPLLRQFSAGFTETVHHRWFIAGLISLAAQLATAFASQQVLLPILSNNRFGSNSLLGTALTAYAVGSVIMVLIVARWRLKRPGIAAAVGLVCYTGVPLSLAFSHSATVIVVAYAVAGAGITLFNVPWLSAVQREMPSSQVGVITSIDFFISYSFVPLGLAAVGPAVEAFGITAVLVAGAVVTFLFPLVALLVPGMTRFHDPRTP